MGVNEMAAKIAAEAPVRAAKPWSKILYLQVLIAILLGVLIGALWPNLATNDWIKALGDGFIKLIKMVIAPIIFCTVVSASPTLTMPEKSAALASRRWFISRSCR